MNNKTLTTLGLATLLTAGLANAASVHVFESGAQGFNTKSYFYDNGAEVVAFDSQFTPELAQESIEFLRTKTQSPITHLIITHPNPDKFNGISVFKSLGAKVVASKATVEAMEGVHAYKQYFFVEMAKMFTKENYPKLVKPEVVFERELSLKLSKGDLIKLTELNQAGVSSNQTLAYLPEAKALIVGDLIHHRAHAWLEGGIVKGKPTPAIRSWLTILKSLRQHFPGSTKVLGGRGESANLTDAVKGQIEYLEAMDKLTSEYAKELKGAEANYGELQARAQKLFPEYQLGYMVQYGAYGLVEAKR